MFRIYTASLIIFHLRLNSFNSSIVFCHLENHFLSSMKAMKMLLKQPNFKSSFYDLVEAFNCHKII